MIAVIATDAMKVTTNVIATAAPVDSPESFVFPLPVTVHVKLYATYIRK